MLWHGTKVLSDRHILKLSRIVIIHNKYVRGNISLSDQSEKTKKAKRSHQKAGTLQKYLISVNIKLSARVRFCNRMCYV